MTLLTYQVFKTVSEMGSFHKAASVLGLTPSAISHAISSMENELGFSVLTRNKAGVTLTNYGEHILPYVNAVLNSDESLKQVVAEFKGLKQGTVKIGCFSSACTSWMPDIINSFMEIYPAIRIEVFQGTYDDVIYWIKNGVVDFGFLSQSSSGDLNFEPIYRDPLLCITPASFEKEEGTEMTAEEMSKSQFVVQRESTDADIANYMKSVNLDPQSNYHVVDDLSTIAMVAHGFGICIMPELVMHDITYEVKRYPIADAERMIGLSCLNPQFMAPAVRTLYQHIKDNYSNL
ncbi:LysR family transcriptional regulator [[Clostridium] aminophilum]|uniref:LysR family transcriptional regulator n=1 Tax=[Clostridium] aminophilum TaxID=1526 RepID=UPI0026EEBDB4|nr:LysR family transcriptional regulator [[Clostridium] aminophilum]MDD6197131.1 LysR family transcriptional regulator [[Clostridium] aminophilum]